MTPEKCPDCNGELAEIGGGRDAVACVDCGVVNPQRADDNEERTIQLKESATGAIDENEQTSDSRFESWKSQINITDSTDENLIEILSIVDTYTEKLTLPQSVQLQAAELLFSAWEEGVFAGREKEAVIAGGVYAASRKDNHPRPLTNVSATAGVPESKVNNAYRVMVSELSLEVPVTTPDEYAAHLGRNLSLSQSVVEEAEVILTRDLDCRGNPAGVAASLLYLLAPDDQNITLQQAGSVAGVSKETVWRHTQTLRDSVPEVS